MSNLHMTLGAEGAKRGLFFLMLLDVSSRKTIQMGRVNQPDFFRLFFRPLDRPPVPQHTPDHPERADADGGGAMNERGAVFGVVGDLEKFVDLLFLRFREHYGDIKVSKAYFL